MRRQEKRRRARRDAEAAETSQPAIFQRLNYHFQLLMIPPSISEKHMQNLIKHARMMLVVAAVLTFSFSSVRQSSHAPSRNLKALVGETLIDGVGSTPLRNSIVIIEGERIKAIGQVGTLPVPAGAEIISTEGMTVLPGLWDMHVHLMINGHSDYGHWEQTYPPQMEKVIMPASARQLLMAGITSARDLGGPLEASIAVRERIKKG